MFTVKLKAISTVFLKESLFYGTFLLKAWSMDYATNEYKSVQHWAMFVLSMVF